MVCRIKSATIRGIEAMTVDVETDISDGLPAFDMVGLLSSEVKEARERVRTALKNSGFIVPPKRITINLAPADIRKTGTYYDMAIALSILISMGIVDENRVDNYLFAGELGLAGNFVSVNGILPIVLKGIEMGMDRIFVPVDNLSECAMVDEKRIVGVRHLKHLAYMLTTGDISDEYQSTCEDTSIPEESSFDFEDVLGQRVARRAAEIAAAGMHNLLLMGTPGAGKTMIAKCMPSIMPTLTRSEELEVAGIHSVAGLLKDGRVIRRPFRSPHHTSTVVSLTGGGNNPKPGEISLAHRGVLFLDELPEFSRQAIEVLRQPLEERCIYISRVGGRYRFPADFIMMATSNPCKCGYYPDRNRCKCTENDVKKYLDRISGPIMDRIDLCVGVEPVKYEELNSSQKGESSSSIKGRVEQACKIQQERYKKLDIDFNGQLDGRYINEYCRLGNAEQRLMEQAFERLKLSARSYNKIIKVARTIADIEGRKEIERTHLAEAMSYRF